MEAQLKTMRVPELKELATKAGLNVAAKLTKDKIIALLLESPNVAPMLDGASANGAPAAPSSDSHEPPAALAPVVKPPAKGSLQDLLAPLPAVSSAPTVGASQATPGEPAHVSKPVEVNHSTPAASNAYGSTATSAAALSAPIDTVPDTATEAVPSATAMDLTVPEIPINPLEGSSKPVAGTAQFTEEEKRAARKARFEREWQLDQTRKDAEAAAKAGRDDGRAKEAAAKKVAEAAKQAASPVESKAPGATKANGSNGHGLSADLVEKRKARFAQAGDQVKPSAPITISAPPSAPVLTGADVEKASSRKNKFNSLLPGQPGYEDAIKEADAPSKRQRDEDAEAPLAKKAKNEDSTA